MSTIYTISSYFGYFLPMIVFMVLAVIFARRFAAWILYGAGAAVELISLVGNQKKYRLFGLEELMKPYWMIYLGILVVVAIIIILRRYGQSCTKNPQDNTDILKNKNIYETKAQSDSPIELPKRVHRWRCSCGNMITSEPCPYCSGGNDSEEKEQSPEDN
ncbi:MAG: hypothetical protein E7578_01010 [Ruminococcaceae bacterium]|nr:hypothetical protein [Oscillospiraceae bacterium]